MECYRHMVAARIWSTRAFNLQRQGRVGTFAPIDGNEAAVVGAVQALDPATDWVIPQYREQFALQRFGDEVLDQQVLYLRGHPAGTRLSRPRAGLAAADLAREPGAARHGVRMGPRAARGAGRGAHLPR